MGLLLSACGGDSNPSTPATITYWKFTDSTLPDSYITLIDSKVITQSYLNDSQYQCMRSVSEYNILSIDNNQYTLEDPVTHQTAIVAIEIVNDQLKYGPVIGSGSNISYLLDSIEPSAIPTALSCTNTGSPGSVIVSMVMRKNNISIRDQYEKHY